LQEGNKQSGKKRGRFKEHIVYGRRRMNRYVSELLQHCGQGETRKSPPPFLHGNASVKRKDMNVGIIRVLGVKPGYAAYEVAPITMKCCRARRTTAD
jgi:hypothetical protein